MKKRKPYTKHHPKHALPAAYIWDRLQEVKTKYDLTTTYLAEVIGYERSSTHRMLSGGTQPRLSALYSLSKEFGLPLSFWFPPEDGEVAIKLPEPIVSDAQKCLCAEAQEDAPAAKRPRQSTAYKARSVDLY